MNLSAIQLVQPIGADTKALPVLAARVGRLILLYLLIALTGALVAFLTTLLTWRVFLLSGLGLSVALVSELWVVTFLVPRLPLFALAWGEGRRIQHFPGAYSAELHAPPFRWRSIVRRALFDVFVPLLINMLAVISGWEISSRTLNPFLWGLVVGLSVGTVLVATSFVIRLISYRRFRRQLSQLENRKS
jgi:hypothetical protein